MSSKDRPVCLVTGGSSGIGLATAIKFASENFNIVICGRDREKLENAQASIIAHRVMCEPVTFDLDQGAERAGEIANFALENFGRIDVLVNNAGVAPLASFEDFSVEEFERSINVNIRSVFYLTQRVWRTMSEKNSGTIVNVSSMAAVDPFPGFSAYGASKAWVDLMTRALADEGKDKSLRVFSVRPGAVETPLLRSLFPDFPAEQAVGPNEIAEVVWRLCQPDMQYCSGQSIVIKK